MKKNPNLRIIGARGRIYLPKSLLAALKLAEGTIVEAKGYKGAVVLIPMQVEPALNPFAKEDEAHKAKLADMTTRELYELAASAAAEYQSRIDEKG